MPTYLLLPKNKRNVGQAIKEAADRSRRVRNIKAATWWTVHYYLQGCRDFDYISYTTGEVDAFYPDTQGVRFKHEELVRKYQEVAGQLLRLPINPRVRRRAACLDALRKESVSQLALDSVFSQAELDRVKAGLVPLLLRFGTAAVLVERGGHPDEPPVPRLTVVPPWQLLSIPADPSHEDEVQAIIRERWVSREWLRQMGYGRVLSANEHGIVTRAGRRGEPPASSVEGAQQEGGVETMFEDLDTPPSPDGDASDTFVRITETWVRGENDRLMRYVLTSGSVVLDDRDFSEVDYTDVRFMPIHVARFLDCGGFWGRGLLELLLPANVELEYLLESLFKNIEDLDLFGVMFVPGDIRLNRADLEKPVEGPRVVPYEVSMFNPNSKPFNIAPANPGTLPAEVAKIAMMLVERLAPSSDLLRGEAPGRADSATGFNILFELSTLPLTMPVLSMARALAGAYKTSLALMRQHWDARQLSVRSMTDDTVAGVIIDPATGTLDTSKNALPHPDEVDIYVSQNIPRTEEQELTRLLLMLDKGIITPRWFRILARRRNLDLPLANENEWQNYRRAMFNNVILFNDGITPNIQGVVVRDEDMHDIHIAVIDAFTSRPEFQLASPEVREAFARLRQEHMAQVGAIPDQLPLPEELVSPGAPGGLGGLGGLGNVGGMMTAGAGGTSPASSASAARTQE